MHTQLFIFPHELAIYFGVVRLLLGILGKKVFYAATQHKVLVLRGCVRPEDLLVLCLQQPERLRRVVVLGASAVIAGKSWWKLRFWRVSRCIKCASV